MCFYLWLCNLVFHGVNTVLKKKKIKFLSFRCGFVREFFCFHNGWGTFFFYTESPFSVYLQKLNFSFFLFFTCFFKNNKITIKKTIWSSHFFFENFSIPPKKIENLFLILDHSKKTQFYSPFVFMTFDKVKSSKNKKLLFIFKVQNYKKLTKNHSLSPYNWQEQTCFFLKSDQFFFSFLIGWQFTWLLVFLYSKQIFSQRFCTTRFHKTNTQSFLRSCNSRFLKKKKTNLTITIFSIHRFLFMFKKEKLFFKYNKKLNFEI
jgi:hypothetical protein